MKSAVSLRLMTEADLPFADSLRAIAGWNQTLDDWRRFLALEPNGCFLAEHNGSPAGTATTIRYGSEIAWIGMVLVHPDHRRRGIGRALLEHCIAHLQNSGIKSIKLDATPEGQILYEKLGFKYESSLTRWKGFGRPIKPHLGAKKNDLPKMIHLDERAFGANRSALINALAAQSEIIQFPNLGFCMLRRGSVANYVGPLVAKSPQHAFHLVEPCLSEDLTIIEIPDRNADFVDWIKHQNFDRQRPLIRMRLGAEIIPAAPETLFAIASPETG